MRKGRQKVPHLDAPLGLPTCLWLELAGLFLLVPWVMGLAGTGGPEAQSPGALSWAVHLGNLEGKGQEETLEQKADALAQAAGLVNAGRIGELQGHYLFVQPAGHQSDQQVEAIRQQAEAVLARHEAVHWHSEQKLLKRAKRSVHFNDPKYPQQWHLNNRRSPGRDINVTGVWERNVTGRGVTVVVVDDGVEHTIQDIAPNYSPEGSYDLNSNDPDPMPHPDVENGNHHGTRCAGEIAAVPNNSFCAVGVAYGSRVAGIRLLDGPLTDSMEAVAFNKHYQINDIYSCSWGPDDDGKTVDGPHQLGKAALQHGVIAGRQGFGSIFVVASGNGGQHNDNCNYDGYANSIYTVTIGAVDEDGRMPFYAEECASMLAVTFSGGDKMLRSIVTTDWDLQKGTGCTEGHTGTSAAAPLAAGMIALMLQVRPCLTWRDVQHIIVFTATQYEDRRADWVTNEAGFSHSHQHGFGLLKAWRLVNAAKIWTSVPYLASYVSPVLKENKAIPLSPHSLEVLWNVSRTDLEMSGLQTLEHVAVTVSITHPRRGSLELQLFCPSGMMSLIGAPRSMDSDPSGFEDWTFSTVRCWGERARGPYRLVVRDVGDEALPAGTLRQWQLTLYGSAWSPVDIRDRQRLLDDAMSGKYLHDGFTLPCPPGLKIPEEVGYTITPNTLKTLVLVGCFAAFWTVYYVLEVYLSQRNVASHPVCRSGPCLGPQRNRKAREEGAELESVPLCSSKDPGGVEAEAAGPLIAADDQAPGLQGRAEQMC
ncbi:proprotein convertase subtilisin/kexin type 7 isoform X1 [Myotis myotis]|uniref:Proprotein convertase subtilisin/kexin type 7 n=2 Tax=Myotis myotis TaxID=51298 RepID=A0A7J7VJT2_MYOMY|nr:proprotein convertase subtilisin/kexin type 7 isoform X1 [Myotis myotis]XP_036180101.1 proprotein convertase subtilisin/kexin type 7 isoform X1 [Myotis myotis]XP_036180102.1 proprotein convertase subtilisin/kexin type 7 isoform X1 [Myotis myotis]XP_036180104.1 proprotein convertase subtilisin/kexin type 7 isoform X1 [Myotis myotis]KAF6325399.1 proprotein convertase subtilisin/kexin type 7 [Myotis myotis]